MAGRTRQGPVLITGCSSGIGRAAALSPDALRMEVSQFGIDVVLIEPGPVKTPWNDVAAACRRREATGRAPGRPR